MLGEDGTQRLPLVLKKAVVKLVKIDDFCIKDDGFSDVSISSDDSPKQGGGGAGENRGRKRRYNFNDSSSSNESRASTGSASRSCSESRGSSFSEDSGSPRRKSKRPKVFVVPPESLIENKKRSSSDNSKNLDDNLNDACFANRNTVPSQRCRDCRQLKNDNPNLRLFPGDSAEAVRKRGFHGFHALSICFAVHP